MLTFKIPIPQVSLRSEATGIYLVTDGTAVCSSLVNSITVPSFCHSNYLHNKIFSKISLGMVLHIVYTVAVVVFWL